MISKKNPIHFRVISSLLNSLPLHPHCLPPLLRFSTVFAAQLDRLMASRWQASGEEDAVFPDDFNPAPRSPASFLTFSNSFLAAEFLLSIARRRCNELAASR